MARPVVASAVVDVVGDALLTDLMLNDPMAQNGNDAFILWTSFSPGFPGRIDTRTCLQDRWLGLKVIGRILFHSHVWNIVGRARGWQKRVFWRIDVRQVVFCGYHDD